MHIAQNKEKTRKAVVYDKAVTFYRRAVSREHYVSPKPWWRNTYHSHDEAVEVADRYAEKGGRPLFPGEIARRSASLPLFDGVPA